MPTYAEILRELANLLEESFEINRNEVVKKLASILSQLINNYGE